FDSALSNGSFVDDPLAFAADADLSAVAEDLVADARLRAAFGAHELNVRGVQRRLALDDAALDVLARVGPRVPLDHVDALDDQAVLPGGSRKHLQDAAAL